MTEELDSRSQEEITKMERKLIMMHFEYPSSSIWLKTWMLNLPETLLILTLTEEAVQILHSLP